MIDTLNSFMTPSKDYITVLFEFGNSYADHVINFYLSNPRTFFAVIICTIYVIYYLCNAVKVRPSCSPVNQNRTFSSEVLKFDFFAL